MTDWRWAISVAKNGGSQERGPAKLRQDHLNVGLTHRPAREAIVRAHSIE